MMTQKIDQMNKFEMAESDFHRAWQDMENAALKLQEATERARQSLSDVQVQMAHDPKSWQMLDPLLYLEELILDAGRVVDDMKRKVAVPEEGRELSY